MSNWRVTELSSANESVLAGINRLIPQLSQRARLVTLELLERIVSDPDTHLLTAISSEEPSVVAGMLTLVVFAIPTGIRAWIEDVVVDEKLRGSGIGRLLTTSALEIAKDLGAVTVDLTSRSDRKAAHALYEGVGFELRDTNVYRYLWSNE
jgi:ribosomal protein S18 acetylase RimI-like enzyme